MGIIRRYNDLIVWQKAMDLVKTVYLSTSKLPTHERYGMISQMRRAAVSIPSNIAEGQSRNSTGEFRQQLGVSKGSLAELETLVQLTSRLGYLSEAETTHLQTKCSEISRLLSGLLKSLK